MVFIEVYSKNEKIIYKSGLLYKATFIHLFFGIFSIIIPYVLAYHSGGFWKEKDVFYEQPTVLFKGDYIFIATSTNSSSPIVCSTYGFYKQFLNNFLNDLSCMEAKAREIDFNYDNKVDKFTIELNINIPEHTKITSVNLIIPVDYRLKTVCPLHMESAIIYQNNNVHPTTTELKIISDLTFFQKTSVYCNHKNINNIYNTSLITSNERSSYELENIYANYLERDVTTHLSNVYTVVKMNDLNKFSIKLSVRYPENKIYYRSGFWKVMKWAWIQYLSIYVLVVWLIQKIKAYIFENKLVFLWVLKKPKVD